MKIAIYNNGIPFTGDTPLQRPLGGSESGIVYMARALARCGHTVSVYCNCPEPGKFDAVDYLHYHDFFTDHRQPRWDAVIAFRSFDPLLLGRIAPRMIYWTGDASNQPSLHNFDHDALQQNLDLVLCVSQWHRESFIRQFGLAPDKVVATRNGFAPELVPHARTKDTTRSVYTSTPFRGLDILLEVFPAIRRRVATATLDVFSSMKVYGWTTDQDREAYGVLYDASSQAGVSWKGSVNQSDLLEHLAHAGLMLYPNTFDETSCISAIEAQAAGCPIVTSARAGLKETVAHQTTGFCVEGDPRSTQYKKVFVEAAVGLLSNPDLFGRMSAAARNRAFRSYTWNAIAAEWTDILSDMPAKAVSGRYTGPLSLMERAADYLRVGNVNAAQRILVEIDATPFFRQEAEGLKQYMQPGIKDTVAHGGA